MEKQCSISFFEAPQTLFALELLAFNLRRGGISPPPERPTRFPCVQPSVGAPILLFNNPTVRWCTEIE